MNKNSVYLATGRIFSSIGDSIYSLTIVWYIYHLTHSTIYTGFALLLMYTAQALHFLFGPFIESFNKQKVLIYAQILQFVLMCIVPIAILLHHENIFIILGVIFGVSILENFEGTAEMSIVPKLIDKAHVGQYNACVNSTQKVFDLVVSGLFSLVIVYISVRDIYFFNAFTFLVACILFMKIKYKNDKSERDISKSYAVNLKQGLNYFKNSIFMWITIPLALVNGVLSGLNAVMPKYAEEIGNGNDYGWLMFSISCGLLIGSVLSQFFMKYKVGQLVAMMSFLICLLMFISFTVHETVPKIVVLGMALVPLGIINMTLMTYTQVKSDPSYLARTMAISESVLFIMMPIGSMAGGIIAQTYKASIIILLCAFTFLMVGLLFMLNHKLKRLSSITKD